MQVIETEYLQWGLYQKEKCLPFHPKYKQNKMHKSQVYLVWTLPAFDDPEKNRNCQEPHN